MFNRLLIIVSISVMLSGCYMVPLALVGPATSGFTTASLIQSGASTTASYLVKKTTGKSITEHALDSINEDMLEQTYFPSKNLNSIPIEK